ncbi:aminoglycoside phosphotransferase family protein [Mesorhizobium sp. 1M-11]|uniref:phosphotransferase family protein n=1 Tax=Mesorhizobium sp. 1M-11 TaxID=1529006 RepID=UPI0006C76F28|nr:aminoglycoside phosphotransferase family protein [Mesorhizobium sp. 1M-11]
MQDDELDTLKETIVARFPDLAGSRFRLLTQGWDSIAVDVDDRLIFKFPRNEIAQKSLIREISLLDVIRPAVTMPVPDIRLIDGSRAFSRHEKLKGSHLETPHYTRLSAEAREDLALRLARFYVDLHGLDMDTMRAAGAEPVEAWSKPDEVRVKVLPLLSGELKILAERIIASWADLPPDPYGTTYGFFDGHGWNMAFDHETGRLSGVYDFADSGFGPLHRDFIYSNFISTDLTERIISHYEILSGCALERERVEVLTGAHRLWELAEAVDDPPRIPFMIDHFSYWAAALR